MSELQPEADLQKEPAPDPNGNSNLFVWEPGFSYELPHQVSWQTYELLLKLGGKRIWYGGGLLLVGFVGKERAMNAFLEAQSMQHQQTIQEQAKEIARLRDALKPFADLHSGDADGAWITIRYELIKHAADVLKGGAG